MGRPFSNRTCSVDGCDRKHCAKGLCRPHWKQARRRPPQSLEERFWSKVQKTESCWLWTAALNQGYGHFRGADRTTIAAHHQAWLLARGPIPDGLHLDHLCRNRACVNPDHLEPVTQRENNLRSMPYRTERHQERCPEGHLVAGPNLIVTAGRSAHDCAICRLMRTARRHVEKLGVGRCRCAERATALAREMDIYVSTSGVPDRHDRVGADDE